ncbi:uncharacterized protein TNCV_4599331 [Trichonephila clavipes]|nr:uncharacterized protein TNCV_4599331 [Trichonephila clavipes]
MACDAEDCGFQMLNDDEIVTSVREEFDPVDDETDEDEDNNNNESSKGPSNADAFSALETVMDGTNNNQSGVLLNYCCSRESEIAQRKNEGVQCRMAMGTNSWPANHEFESWCTEDRQCRGADRQKFVAAQSPDISIVWKIGKQDQVSSLSLNQR